MKCGAHPAQPTSIHRPSVRKGRSPPASLPQSSAAVSLKPDIRPGCVSGCQSCQGKEVLDSRYIVPIGLQSHSAVRWCTVSRVSRDTDPPRRGIQRGRQTVPTEIPVTEDYLSAQPVRRGLSQSAKPARESPVPIRLASVAWNCGDRMHDPPGSRARCFSSVQGVQNISEQVSAPRRVGPQCFSKNSAGSQIQCCRPPSLRPA